MRLSLFFALLPLSCAGEDEPGDPMGTMGASEDVADDDGDGFTNAEEEELGTDPNSRYSRPYTGGYNVGVCDELPAATGPTGTGENANGVQWAAYQEGDVAENWTMVDQHGEEVDLYSFCGKHVMLAVSAGWCGPCRSLAGEMQAMQDQYRDQDVQIIEVITDNNAYEQPDGNFVSQWANQYGFEDIPVLILAEPTSWNDLEFHWEVDTYIPSLWHIGPDGTILSADAGIHDPGVFLN